MPKRTRGFAIPNMDNAAAFTYGRYRKLLQEFADRGYAFVPFSDAQDLLARRSMFVLIRHDVDFDLDKALRMARLEARCGVSATYFFMVRTEHYNVLSRDGSQVVSGILDLGHHLGLHFDRAAYPDGADVRFLASACATEARILGEWFGRRISIVSYHRPDRIVLSGEPAVSAPLQHTYMPLYIREISYYSDSRGEWKFGDPTASGAFEQGRPMHVLVHPIWWDEHQGPPQRALADFVARRTEALEASVELNCSVYHPGRRGGGK